MQVLKIGGNELAVPGFLEKLADTVHQFDEPTVIVHGGGKAIAELQSRLGLETVKVEGLRVTDAESLSVAQMVLTGMANKQIVTALLRQGVDAIGMSGVDAGLISCKKKCHPKADLGFVGEAVDVRVDLLELLMSKGLTPVVSPISWGEDGETYNINADEAACAVAKALGADVLAFVSNVAGVQKEGTVIHTLTPDETEKLIDSGVIAGGMVPKVRAALDAVRDGVGLARIVDLAGLAGSGGTRFTAQASG
jgi:acetylglutamate kinase